MLFATRKYKTSLVRLNCPISDVWFVRKLDSLHRDPKNDCCLWSSWVLWLYEGAFFESDLYESFIFICKKGCGKEVKFGREAMWDGETGSENHHSKEKRRHPRLFPSYKTINGDTLNTSARFYVTVTAFTKYAREPVGSQKKLPKFAEVVPSSPSGFVVMPDLIPLDIPDKRVQAFLCSSRAYSCAHFEQNYQRAIW